MEIQTIRCDNEELFDDEVSTDLVLDVLIQNTTDVEFLKKCRLTNKNWNIEACRRLQTVAITTLEEDDDEDRILPKEFMDILAARSFGRFSTAPSPFKNFNVVCERFDDTSYKDLVLSPNIRATHFKLRWANMFRDCDVQELNRFHRLNQEHMTNLTITEVESAAIRKLLRGIKFTSLKKLVVESTCFSKNANHCDHVKTLQRALEYSALSHLHIRIDDAPCFFSLMNMNLSQIQELNLELSYRGRECWDALATLQLPCLKRLYLSSGCINDEPFQQQINLFLGNVAPLLNKLKLDLDSELETDLVFPQLTSIKIPSPTLAKLQQLITPARFPKLQKICLTDCFCAPHNLGLGNDFSSHQGIKSFGIEIEANVTEKELDANFRRYLANLKLLFPNIEDFGITSSCRRRWTSSLLLYIHSVFPNLKTLRLYSKFDFLTLAGITCKQALDYASSGVLVQNIPRRKCILDFQDLKKLILDPNSSVSNELIQHCLNLLPNLKHIRIPWNSRLSVALFANSFRNLQDLELYKDGTSKKQQKRLQRALPACVVQCYPKH